MSKVVVFPAPLGPSRTKRELLGIVKLTLSTTLLLPKNFEIFRTRRGSVVEGELACSTSASTSGFVVLSALPGLSKSPAGRNSLVDLDHGIRNPASIWESTKRRKIIQRMRKRTGPPYRWMPPSPEPATTFSPSQSIENWLTETMAARVWILKLFTGHEQKI